MNVVAALLRCGGLTGLRVGSVPHASRAVRAKHHREDEQ
ncbi:hypothetical protein BZL30_0708 [Mycobacterium kansasii]|uniref:Uncharacterized protein n=1 Tax=Mycobacterium kansasii TaxID=1768 RepID=A0A1V3XXC3_MYCKA|nr:hypothetical protein MKSMC1_18850 [Mycobacterium kansasii]OOK82267.1 hypothetical protein BZL30_0708 [Mycobacterium kansasii]OOK83865.1 hypothetical protein BZL29_1157 [Mycobacterium kansasii]